MKLPLIPPNLPHCESGPGAGGVGRGDLQEPRREAPQRPLLLPGRRRQVLQPPLPGQPQFEELKSIFY